MFVIKSKWLVSIKSLQVLRNKVPACASVSLQSVFADRSGRVAALAFCCTLRWAAPTPTRPESSKKKKKKKGSSWPPTSSEVSGSTGGDELPPFCSLSPVSQSQRSGWRFTARCEAADPMPELLFTWSFHLPSDKMKTFDGSQTRHQPCLHPPPHSPFSSPPFPSTQIHRPARV